MLFTFRSLAFTPAIAAAATALVAARAFPSVGVLVIDLRDSVLAEHLLVLEICFGLGFADLVQDSNPLSRWRLTSSGVLELTPARLPHSPTPALSVRPSVDIHHRTAFELLMLLKTEGWLWKAWRSRTGCTILRRLLCGDIVHDWNEPRLSLWSVPLASRGGISRIDHGKLATYYNQLLQSMCPGKAPHHSPWRR